MRFSTIKTTTLLILFIATTIISCSSDDDSSSPCTETLWYQDLDLDGLGNPNVSISSCTQPDGYLADNTDTDDTAIFVSTTNYLSFALNNNWIYDVTTDDGTNPTTSSVDDITVDETSTINSNEYFGMSSSIGSTGTMSQLFDQNFFRVDNGVSYMQGGFTLPLSNFGGTDLTINLDDAKLIDETKASGTVLTSQSDITAQTIGGFDLDITYTFKTIQREILASHTVGTETYNDIIKSDIVLSIKVTTEVNVGVPIVVTILDTQDILTINNFYANNIGLVDSNTTFTYTLEDLSTFGITLPFPDTATIITAQEITAYTIN
jgi:hypothetical protein